MRKLFHNFFFLFKTDRERQSEYRLQVVASDGGQTDKKSTTVPVYITLEDVNDTPPVFSQSQYSAVVPENSPIGTVVAKVKATDPDSGPSGEVTFEFPESPELQRYKINRTTGEIKTNAKLTGKGRAAPYVLTVRAVDKGVPQLFSDTEVYIIGKGNRNVFCNHQMALRSIFKNFVKRQQDF